MFEPTESEDKLEIDRFIDALLHIKKEIKEIEDGLADRENNVIKNAPHTLKRLISPDWESRFPYSREKAAFPTKWIHHRGKVFATVARVD
jgi:glycine dehydrogenase